MERSWLVEVTSAGNSRVLYVVPHAGAGASAVKAACRLVGDILDTVAVRLPGRESLVGQPPRSDMAGVAGELAGQILAHAGEREVLLYGHCSGAVLAYEAGRRLPGDRLAGLVVSANEAPDRVPADGIWRLPGEDFLARVAADGYLPPAVAADPDMLEIVEPALRADYRLVEEHPPGREPLDVPVLALIGDREHAVAVEDVAAWERYTRAGFRLQVLDGGHNLLLDEAEAVGAALRGLVTGTGGTVRP